MHMYRWLCHLIIPKFNDSGPGLKVDSFGARTSQVWRDVERPSLEGDSYRERDWLPMGSWLPSDYHTWRAGKETIQIIDFPS